MEIFDSNGPVCSQCVSDESGVGRIPDKGGKPGVLVCTTCCGTRVPPAESLLSPQARHELITEAVRTKKPPLGSMTNAMLAQVRANTAVTQKAVGEP